jgi:predicted metal-dependent peptidase
VNDLKDKTVEMAYGDIIEQLIQQHQDPDEQNQKQPGGFDSHEWDKGDNGQDGSDGDGQSGDGMSQQEIDAQVSKWSQNLANAAQYARSQGNMPAGMERLIGDVLAPKVSWKALLLKYLRAHLTPTDWSYHKPGRKSYALDIYLPTVIREGTQVEVVVDTSGSIDEKQLSEFLAEIVGIAKAFPSVEMWVSFVDTKVYDGKDGTPKGRYKVDNGEIAKILAMTATGGGGTQLEKGLLYIKEHNPNVPVVCVLTDGYDSYTHKGRDFPFEVIWCITDGGQTKQPYGKIVRMNQ